MNRIILIGNGFDLAHGLETSYKNFIDWLWKDLATNIKTLKGEYEDGIFSVKGVSCFSGGTDLENMEQNINAKKVNITPINSFYKILKSKISQQNWVDIEEEYYQQIKNILRNESLYYKSDEGGKTAIEKLNAEFEVIKQKLEDYLSDIENKGAQKIDSMCKIFCDNFKHQDFPNNKKILLYNTQKNSEDSYYKYNEYQLENYCEHYTDNERSKGCAKPLTEEDIVASSISTDWFHETFLKNIFPANILVLNFNYTKTDAVYCNDVKTMNDPNHPSFNIIRINIHGELKSKENPIVFGYGDELADEYKELEKLHDKEYFKNIKSIKYLNTNNYRNLLNFADSDYFQIFTLGHSCGNSDRTLLNTLFEHKNCISIKPFYHKKEEDGKIIDDYEEIVINISRNFENKKLLRERVVNKTFCEALPQINKKS